MDLNDRALQPSNAHVLICWARLCWGVGEESNLVLGVIAEFKPPAIAAVDPISNKQQRSSKRGAGMVILKVSAAISLPTAQGLSMPQMSRGGEWNCSRA